MSIKQEHQYVCLILRKTRINVDFSELRDEFWWKNGAEGYISLCSPCPLVGKSIGLGLGASVEMKITFVSLNLDVCIVLMIMLCSQKY
jgi:hypothetical protein